jgi:hypothetical protein
MARSIHAVIRGGLWGVAIVLALYNIRAWLFG